MTPTDKSRLHALHDRLSDFLLAECESGRATISESITATAVLLGHMLRVSGDMRLLRTDPYQLFCDVTKIIAQSAEVNVVTVLSDTPGETPGDPTPPTIH